MFIRDENGRFVKGTCEGFKKGHKTNVGRKMNDATRQKIFTVERAEKIRQSTIGPKNHQWRGGGYMFQHNESYRTLKKHCVTIPQGCDVHHKDGNRNNNDISNLLVIRHDKHTRLHWKQGKKHTRRYEK